MLNKLLTGLLAIACIAMGFCFGVYYGQETLEPQYVEVPVITTTFVIPPPDEVMVEKEVIVERVVELREFTSLGELEEWLAQDRTDGLHFMFGWDEEGKATEWYTHPDFQDCDDYAAALQKAAMKDGYLMSIQIDTKKEHALNSVFIGNEIYFIEPQTDEVWLECYRDKELNGKKS